MLFPFPLVLIVALGPCPPWLPGLRANPGAGSAVPSPCEAPTAIGQAAQNEVVPAAVAIPDTALLVDLAAAAAPHDEHGGHIHGQTLHFSHPILGESPSPDTKLRLGGIRGSGDEGDATTLFLEAEYAFDPAFSIGLDVPYTFLDPDGGPSEDALDNVGVVFKFANFAFADRGLLLGYGIEFGLPTGDEDAGIGSDHLFELAPFLDFGYMAGNLETVGFATFGIPTHQRGSEESETELESSLSFLYHVNESVAPLLEFDSQGVLSGDEDDLWIVNVSPGVKLAPFADKSVKLGLSVGWPLTDDEEFETRVAASLFCHL